MLFRAFFMALGMFSIFPTRNNSWNLACAPLIMPMYPFVGLVIGLAWFAIALITGGLPIALHSAAIGLAPIILTGLLHIDGFMDTADAVLSRQSLEDKRRILKDSNVGTFAVVSVICLFFLQFCSVYSIAAEGKDFAVLIFIPIASRCAIGVALLNLSLISQSGYMHTFQEGAKLRHTLAIVATMAVALVAAYVVGGMIALAVFCVILICAACASAYLYRQLQGFSGDLCGCASVVSELCGLLVLAIL